MARRSASSGVSGASEIGFLFMAMSVQKEQIMATRLFYIDESYDRRAFCLSAISIRHTDWRECFNEIKKYRVWLRDKYGIPLKYEIHSSDLVSGRGSLGTMQ